MKGHDKIIEARRMGRKPRVINIIDHPFNLELEFEDVVVFNDPLHSMDFRFLTGCLVIVSSNNQERCDKIEALCQKHHAKQVAAGLIRKYYSWKH